MGTFKGYLNFPAVMQAVGVMIFFKYCAWKKILNKDSQSALKIVAKYTFGVYLVHIYLVEQLPRLIGINSSSFWWRTGGGSANVWCFYKHMLGNIKNTYP